MTINDKLVPLSQLQEGEEGIIQALAGGRELSSRLAGLGMALNMKVKILRSGGGLVIAQTGDTRVALGGGEADKILVYRTDSLSCGEGVPEERKRLLVALAGQPNVGKSTVFNILTGLSQHVGNWPGKTVEKKEGAHICDDVELRIVDLPGTYSLTSFSEEERVARDFILREHPDVIILLANAAALERSLYLLTEILLLGPPVVVAVNMTDVAEHQGIHIDVRALEKALGIPVVEMVASKNLGIKELVSRVVSLARKDLPYRPRLPEIAADHRDVFETIRCLVDDHFSGERREDRGYRNLLAVKLMEGDSGITQIVEANTPPEVWSRIQNLLIRHEDSLHAVVGGRYDWIEEATRAAISRHRIGQVLMTDRIDHVLTRPLFGIPALLAVFAVLFGLTYSIGFPLQKALEWLIGQLAGGVETALTGFPAWIQGLVMDGVIGGVGSVLSFIPILILFFTAIAVLEDVGYMARAAFVMDRFMHLIGLHGKSVIPLCLGFGCNVPAVLATRIVESKKERLLTILLSPFVPCTARLAVLAFVAAAMFAANAATVAWSLLAVNLLVLGFTGMAASRFALKGESMPFIMELPLYRQPDWKTIGTVVWTRTVSFVKKAGTVILAVSVIVWFLSYFPGERIEDSYLAWFGRFLEPFGAPIGLDWRMVTALLTSIIAKENAVATLGVLYGVGREGLVQTLPGVMSGPSALAFLTVLMLFVPCAATVVVMKRELGSWRWFGVSMVLMLIVSFLAGMVAFRLGGWLGL